jgi:hypothetical protein
MAPHCVGPGHSVWDLWWKKWQWTGCSPSTSVFPRQYHATNVPNSSSTRCSYQKLKTVEARKTSKKPRILLRKSDRKLLSISITVSLPLSTTEVCLNVQVCASSRKTTVEKHNCKLARSLRRLELVLLLTHETAIKINGPWRACCTNTCSHDGVLCNDAATVTVSLHIIYVERRDATDDAPNFCSWNPMATWLVCRDTGRPNFLSCFLGSYKPVMDGVFCKLWSLRSSHN